MHELPDAFIRTTREVHGEAGVQWMQALPALLNRYAREWDLALDGPFPNLSYNYVAPARQNFNTPVVLKAGVPHPELLAEIDALRHYDGDGIVRLLATSPSDGVMLLERLVPGEPLSGLEDDDRATTIAAQVMRRLWKPPPGEHHFPTVTRWAAGMQRLRGTFDGGTGPFAPSLVEHAEGLFTELLESMEEPVLLHGDLHHDNILSSSRGEWLALDPKGVVGEREYEVGALIRNPMGLLEHTPELHQLLARRLDLLAEALELSRERLWGWSLAQAVLSAWWSYEDHARVSARALRIAEALLRIKP